MGYYELLKSSAPSFNVPMAWQLPGSGSGGLILCNGGLLRLGAEIKAVTGGRVLVVMGSVVSGLEIGDIVRSLLRQAGIAWDVFGEITGEPDESTIEKLLDAMGDQKYGAVIGIGGGSVMDVAKLAAHAAAGRETFEEKLCKRDFSTPGIPTILIPTTAGSGSESSPYAVLTMAGQKVFFMSHTLLATVSIVDPLLTVEMPPALTATTAFDAMAHGIEGAIARDSPYTGALAAESVALILHHLKTAMECGGDIAARYHLALAAVMGMMSYSMGGGLYAHSISYMLTLRKGIPHGTGCGMALPFTLAYNKREITPFLDRLAAMLQGKSGGARAPEAVISRIRCLYLETSLPATLADVGFSGADIPILAEELLNVYPRANNPRALTIGDAGRLFETMLSGEVAYF